MVTSLKIRLFGFEKFVISDFQILTKVAYPDLGGNLQNLPR